MKKCNPPVLYGGGSDSVAQQVEHYTFNVRVLGSNPSGITMSEKQLKLPSGGFFVFIRFLSRYIIFR
jgi:hypothetical protein